MVIGSNILAGSSGQGGAYEIDQSIRFSADSAYLEKTYSSSESTLTAWSFSAWVKRSLLADEQFIFQAGTTSANLEYLRFTNSDTLEYKLILSSSVDANYITTQVFRDPGAWMQIYVYRSSTTFKLYINGSEVTDFSTSNAPGSSNGMLGSNVRHRIAGDYGSTPANFFGGYLAEMNFVPGTAKAVTDFGETDADTGQWVPVKYTGSYGTNGFYLKGQDSSALGDDSSGNGNDFTSSGLAAADQVTDSPTYNYVTLNPLQKGSNVTLSDGNLVADCGSGSSSTRAFATASIPNSGKWTFQIEAVSSTLGGTDSISSIGIIENPEKTNTDVTTGSKIGQTANQENAGLDFYNGFTKKDNASQITAAQLRNAGDKGIVAYDASTKELWIGYAQSTDSSWTWVNGGDPETGTTPTYTMTNDDMRFAISSDRSKTIVRFGSTGDGIAPPSGFDYLNTVNLDDPSIPDSSAYFQSTLYTGNASTQEVNQSGNSNFEPGLVWIKTRSNAASHALFDQVRGVNKQLRSDSSGAEYTAYSDLLTAFDADGFTLGADATVNNVNVNTYTYAAWQWKADGTSGSSNTDGATSSTVSASTTSGFSIVKWTGTGANTTLGHGLGTTPQMMIIKNLADADSWVVYHEDMGATKGLALDTNALPTTASTFFNDTAPTSSVFSIGSGGRTNGSSDGMIAYCFAGVGGFSKAGSYVANASTDGPFVYCGFRPSFVIFMPIAGSGAGKWMLDTVRSPFNVADDIVQANTSAAESSGSSYRLDFLSNGFKIRTSSDFNSSGRTVAFMAFAESPFKTATAR